MLSNRKRSAPLTQVGRFFQGNSDLTTARNQEDLAFSRASVRAGMTSKMSPTMP